MFQVLIQDRTPAPAVRERATRELTTVIALHAQFRADDLAARREFLAAHAGRMPGRSRAALLRAEVEVTEKRIEQLQRVELGAPGRATRELPRLLRLVGSFVEALEMGQGCLAARMRTGALVGEHARMLLVPRRERGARVQRQIYAQEPPVWIEPANAPCLGMLGNGYVDDALDRMDLVSLVLTFVSHVRTNT
jgi:hypothetical protein